jgi:AAA family ATP:ADP antiporter
MTTDNANFIQRFMKMASKIEARELKSVLLSFAFVLILMSAYYILRPVRDAMASDWTDTEVSFLWNLNFFISCAVVAIYGIAVSKIRFRVLVPSVYAFFGISFVAFFFAISAIEDRDFVDKSFYVWLSVFSLFHISVFWSFMGDLYTKEQAKRLFAFIAAGAAAGGIIGPAIAAIFAPLVGNDQLMLVSAVMLVIPIPIILFLERLKVVELHNEDVHADLSSARIGGNPFAGFKMFVSNPYLLAIGGFILLYTAVGSFVYFEQKNLLAEFDRPERAQILAIVDLVVNVLTFVIGLFVTGRLATRFGMATTLAMVPFFIAAGLVVLAFAPILMVALVLQVARRVGNYAITRPGREMLFTAVDRETRFKAKPVIDIVVYRGGDAISSIAFAGLTDGVGLGLGAMAAIGAGIATAWGAVGAFLGRSFSNLEDHRVGTGDQGGAGAAATSKV